MCEGQVVAVVTAVDAEVPNSGIWETVLPYLSELEAIDDVLVAVPHGNTLAADFARGHGFQVSFGSKEDVALRILEVTRNLSGPVTIARFMLRAFWMDPDLVTRTITQLKVEQADYAAYPLDVNYSFGCDAFSRDALERAYMEIQSLPLESDSRATYCFSPWSYFENHSDFRPALVSWSEHYPSEKVESLRKRYSIAIGSGENSHGSSADLPAARYRWAASQLEGGQCVLDFSSGTGGGTQYLSSFCKEIVGLEPNPDYILEAQSKYADPVFIQGDSSLLASMSKKFDAVVSLHTLEHVDDDAQTLLDLRASLSEGGQLILEVPLLLEFPLRVPLLPFHDREYAVKGLFELLRLTGFQVIQAFGVSRNVYRPLKFAREAAAIVAEKSESFTLRTNSA